MSAAYHPPEDDWWGYNEPPYQQVARCPYCNRPNPTRWHVMVMENLFVALWVGLMGLGALLVGICYLWVLFR